jgi:AcrR family transcriptional regulator
LLDAAEALLAAGGPNAATVPAIAGRAGVAVGSVYRRFPDKDAILREVFVRFFERGRDANRAALSPQAWAGQPLAETIARLIRGMVRGYVDHRSFLAALFRYADAHDDVAFRREAEALRSETLALVAAILLARRDEIRHPAPERAIAFSLTTIGMTLKALVLDSEWPSGPVTPAEVEQELTRMMIGYLLAVRVTTQPIGAARD